MNGGGALFSSFFDAGKSIASGLHIYANLKNTFTDSFSIVQTSRYSFSFHVIYSLKKLFIG